MKNIGASVDAVSTQGKKTDEDWESLCQHIENLPSLEQIICDEKRVEV